MKDVINDLNIYDIFLISLFKGLYLTHVVIAIKKRVPYVYDRNQLPKMLENFMHEREDVVKKFQKPSLKSGRYLLLNQFKLISDFPFPDIIVLQPARLHNIINMFIICTLDDSSRDPSSDLKNSTQFCKHHNENMPFILILALILKWKTQGSQNYKPHP